MMRKLIFLKEFLTGQDSFPFLNQIQFARIEFLPETDLQEQAHKQNILLYDVPSYLSLNPKKQIRSSFSIRGQEGYYIDLSRFSDISTYLEAVQNSGSRSNLRRYTQRLELCFPIRYRAYYGGIEKEEYHRLFVALRGFLVRRFHEKMERNYELRYLGDFEASFYDQILQKRAMMFVIYHGNKPISVRINAFKENLAYYIISGYDIDYSKFHPGLIDMSKNIEWLLEGDFGIYDLLKGYKAHKDHWATDSYYNYHHLYYPITPWWSGVRAGCAYLVTSSKETAKRALRMLRLKALITKVKKLFFFTRKNRFKINSEESKSFDHMSDGEWSLIDIEKDASFRFLRRYVYDFHFKTKSTYVNSVIKKHRDFPLFQIRSENEEIVFEIIYVSS
jgi:hypothetical protein